MSRQCGELRRYYRLTPTGSETLAAEAARRRPSAAVTPLWRRAAMPPSALFACGTVLAAVAPRRSRPQPS